MKDPQLLRLSQGKLTLSLCDTTFLFSELVP